MTKYYEILQELKNEINALGFFHTITQGDVSGIDVNKNNLYPLAHVVINNANFQSQTIVFNVTILMMDQLKQSKEETTDNYRGNDNEIDVLNTMLTLQNRLYEVLRRRELIIQIEENTVSLNPFVMRYENGLAGWEMTINLVTYANMPIC